MAESFVFKARLVLNHTIDYPDQISELRNKLRSSGLITDGALLTDVELNYLWEMFSESGSANFHKIDDANVSEFVQWIESKRELVGGMSYGES